MYSFSNQLVQAQAPPRTPHFHILPHYNIQPYNPSISYNAQLVVPTGYDAAFIYRQQLRDVFEPGQHHLNEATLPQLAKSQEWHIERPKTFQSDLIFINTKPITFQWAVTAPVLCYYPSASTKPHQSHSEEATFIYVGGQYQFQIENIATFIKQTELNFRLHTSDEIAQTIGDTVHHAAQNTTQTYAFAAENLLADNSHFKQQVTQQLLSLFTEYGMRLNHFSVDDIRWRSKYIDVNFPYIDTANQTLNCWKCKAKLPRIQNRKYFSFKECNHCEQYYRLNERQLYLDKQGTWQPVAKDNYDTGTQVNSLHHFHLNNCKECNLATLIPPAKTQSTCSYCDKPQLIATVNSIDEKISPTHIVPFKIDKDRAALTFLYWLDEQKNLPNKVIHYAKENYTIKGIFVPCIMANIRSYTYFKGKKGIPQFPEKKNSIVAWYNREGITHLSFNKQKTFASQLIPKHQLDLLADFLNIDLVAFNSTHLQHKAVETYETTLRIPLKDMLQNIDVLITTAIQKKIGSKHQEITETFTTFNNSTIKFVLAPVWIIEFEYHTKSFQYLIGGNHGKLITTKQPSLMGLLLGK